MTDLDIGRLVYLVLLGGAIAAYFLVANRHRLGEVAQQAAVWGLIFLGAIAAVGLWSDIRSTLAPTQAVMGESGRIEVPRARDGHYYLRLQVNDTPVEFVVDTGATNVVLTRRDAERVGIDTETLQYLYSALTANGRVDTAGVRLDEVALGPVRDTDLRAWVNRGQMQTSLLGMDYLQRFARIEIAGDTLILQR